MMCFKNRLEAWSPGEDRVLVEESVIRKFRITATDGKNHDTGHDNPSAFIQDRLFVSDFDAEVIRIASGEEKSGNEEGSAADALDLKAIEDLEKDLKWKGGKA
jgi:hypothetical protein